MKRDVKKELIKTNRNIANLIYTNFIKDFIRSKDSDALIGSYTWLIVKYNSLHKGITLLCSYDRGEEASILLRSLFEVLLYLELLIKYPKGIIAELIYLHGPHKNYASMSNSRIGSRLGRHPKYRELMKENKKLNDEYLEKKEKFRSLRKEFFPGTKFDENNLLGIKIEELSKIVGMEEMYFNIYWQLSSLVHVNFSAMGSRIEEIPNGYNINPDKTEKEAKTSLFYLLDINLFFLESFYKKKRIINGYKNKRNLIEATLLIQDRKL